MKNEQCPVCYEILEVRYITPCYVCGGHYTFAEYSKSDSLFQEFVLDSGQTLVLCEGCWIEEILSLQGCLADELKLPKSGGIAIGISILSRSVSPMIQKGKYCNSCDKTLNLLNVIREIGNAT